MAAQILLPSQIKSYCEIDSVQFKKFAENCINRGLLRKSLAEYKEFSYVVTNHGKKTLTTAQEILAKLIESKWKCQRENHG